MTTAIRSVLMAASPEEVWAVLADFGSISTWADFVDHSSLLTDQSEGIGTTRRIQMGRTTVVETVSAWEPGVTLSYEITGLPPIVKSVTNTWRLGASGPATMAWIATDVSPASPRPPQLALAKGVARRLAKSSVDMLNDLHAHVVEKRPA